MNPAHNAELDATRIAVIVARAQLEMEDSLHGQRQYAEEDNGIALACEQVRFAVWAEVKRLLTTVTPPDRTSK